MLQIKFVLLCSAALLKNKTKLWIQQFVINKALLQKSFAIITNRQICSPKEDENFGHTVYPQMHGPRSHNYIDHSFKLFGFLSLIKILKHFVQLY